jgi:NAD(P)-dependent dehydrogenase (short-subunit alcohol dehydrogenase family)
MTPLQAPLPSGNGPATTAEDVIRGVDLTGKVAVVTGGYSGLGLETARVLAGAGAKVIVPARDMDRARSAVAGIEGLTIEPMDLIDPASIDAFAERVLARTPAIHILIDSAGVMANPLTRDARGYESQFATNHLGHFQLAARLWPALAAANGARVVSVSSRGHHIAGIDFDDLQFERRDYDPWTAYGQSKTANVLFAVELDRRGRDHGVRALALHPGGIVTPLARHMSQSRLREMGAVDAEGRAVIDPAADRKTVEQGAATSVWCAVSPQLEGRGGVYCENSDIAEAVTAEDPRRVGVKPWAIDPGAARRLWTVSEALTGVRFPV